MTEKGLRCVAKLQLKQVTWDDQDGASVQLKGGPVFLRVCLMGQLEYSELKAPFFPISLEQTLSFERVYSNCRSPSLIQEVMRGEHVKIDLIQVNDDYKGGKIIARCENLMNPFLFPKSTEKGPDGKELDTGRTVALSKSRKYQNPPVLHFDTSLSTCEALIQSAVDMIWRTTTTTAPGQPTPAGAVSRTPGQSTTTTTSVGTSSGTTAKRAGGGVAANRPVPSQTRQHSALHSEQQATSHRPTTPPPQHFTRKVIDPLDLSDGEGGSVMGIPRMPSPDREKRPKTYSSYSSRNPKVVYSPRNQPAKPPVKSPKSASKYNSSVQPHSHVSSWKKLNPDSSYCGSKEDQSKPPFVVRRKDENLISRRDFPMTPSHSTHHSSTAHAPNFRVSTNRTKPALDEHTHLQTTSARGASSLRCENCGTLSQSERKSQPATKSPNKTPKHRSPHSNTGPSKSANEQLVSTSRPIHIYFHSDVSESDLSSNDSLDQLRSEPGNLRQPRVGSPSRVLRNRISDLIDKCGEHEYDADSIGEDDSSVDEQRLRASLAAERSLHSQAAARRTKPRARFEAQEKPFSPHFQYYYH